MPSLPTLPKYMCMYKDSFLKQSAVLCNGAALEISSQIFSFDIIFLDKYNASSPFQLPVFCFCFIDNLMFY